MELACALEYVLDMRERVGRMMRASSSATARILHLMQPFSINATCLPLALSKIYQTISIWIKF
jgi:hypothetical protein